MSKVELTLDDYHRVLSLDSFMGLILRKSGGAAYRLTTLGRFVDDECKAALLVKARRAHA